MKWYWDVKVPEEGDLTREQGWALLAKAEAKLSTALSRLNCLYHNNDENCPLSDEERISFQSVYHRLHKATELLSLDVLDRLAALSEEKDEDPTYAYGVDRLPKEIRDLVRDYHGDIHRYTHRGGDARNLAFAMLEEADFEPEEIADIIKKHMNPDYKHGTVWTCPQCDEGDYGKIGNDYCNRCNGWGFLFSDNKPDDDEYDWSEKGRQALNRHEEWTPEQEKAEQERLRLEWEAA